MRYFLAFLAIFFIGCSTTSNTNTTQIPITFSASAYNSVGNRYMERPTFATLYTPKNQNEPWLNLSMETYGYNQVGQNQIINAFTKNNIPIYIELIDKYLEWEKLATRDKDMLDKKIGSAKTRLFSLEFGFFSGNEQSHYLSIGSLGGVPQFFSKEAALSLRDLLLKFQNGELKPVDTASKYN